MVYRITLNGETFEVSTDGTMSTDDIYRLAIFERGYKEKHPECKQTIYPIVPIKIFAKHISIMSNGICRVYFNDDSIIEFEYSNYTKRTEIFNKYVCCYTKIQDNRLEIFQREKERIINKEISKELGLIKSSNDDYLDDKIDKEELTIVLKQDYDNDNVDILGVYTNEEKALEAALRYKGWTKLQKYTLYRDKKKGDK